MDKSGSRPVKRSRSVSSTASASSSTSSTSDAFAFAERDLSPEPALKLARQSPSSSHFTCTLPPTCSFNPPTFITSDALDAHHRLYHTFVCTATKLKITVAEDGEITVRESPEVGECGRIFPSELVLERHMRENHDPIQKVRQERGEKIFLCIDPPCTKAFRSARGRRKHLIAAHQYPQDYFFGVVLWGVSDVLRKGGGMIRRKKDPRPSQSPEPEPPGPTPEQLAREEAARAEREKEVDNLIQSMAKTSVSMVPRAVRKAQKGKVKLGGAGDRMVT